MIILVINDNKYKLSQIDDEQCANETEILCFLSKIMYLYAPKRHFFFFSKVVKEMSLKQMLFMLFDLHFGEYLFR